MKVGIKNLEGKQFEVQIEGSDTVDALKAKIEAEQSIAVDTQKLIFKGKILAEGNKTIDDYGIKENDFMVIMVSKPKAAPAPKPTPTPAPVSQTPPATTTPAPVSQPTTTAPQTTPASTPSQPATEASVMSQGPEFERNVTSLIEMGFERDLCVRALQAAYGNPERAVDYLMSGNIPNINQAPRPAARTPSAPSQSQQAPSSGAPTTPTQPSSQPQAQGPTVEELAALASILSQGPSGVSQLSAPQIQMLHRIVTMHAAAIRLQASQGGAPTGAPLGGSGGQQLPPQFAALRSNPVFQQMRQLVRQNPQMLQPLLQQLAQSNPQLVQMIQSNPAAFLSLLESDGDDGEGGPQPGVIQVTQAEKEAIDRLVALGFDRSLAIQAFFACDKQEEVAANYLFEHGHDFDGEDDGGDDGSDQ